jgi:hypothetical protein
LVQEGDPALFLTQPRNKEVLHMPKLTNSLLTKQIQAAHLKLDEAAELADISPSQLGKACAGYISLKPWEHDRLMKVIAAGKRAWDRLQREAKGEVVDAQRDLVVEFLDTMAALGRYKDAIERPAGEGNQHELGLQ